jgi:lactate permease
MLALGLQPDQGRDPRADRQHAPVAFGSIATPIITLAETTQLPKDDLGAMVGRQTPLLALIVPLILIYVVDGRRGLRQAWLPALLTGFVFAFGQFIASNYVSVELTDIIGSLLSVGFLVLFLRYWTPGEPLLADPDGDGRSGAGGPRRPAMAGAATHDVRHEAEVARRDREGGDSPKEVAEAFAPT